MVPEEDEGEERGVGEVEDDTAIPRPGMTGVWAE